MKNIHINITGMGCAACVKKCTDALQAVPGITEVSVDLKGKCADVSCQDDISSQTLLAAISAAGFKASL